MRENNKNALWKGNTSRPCQAQIVFMKLDRFRLTHSFTSPCMPLFPPSLAAAYQERQSAWLSER
jgi:hypothetical protein